MKKLLAILLLTVSGTAFADQTAITNFDASKTIFWRDLYPTGGHTLYCDQPFAGHSGLDVEHVYPASWMGAHLGCGSRDDCQDDPTHGSRFNHMEADLHNLFPAMAGLNRTRSNNTFGLIPGEARSLLICDFESDSTNDVTEPRPGARGDIARAIFYMHQEYDLPIDAALLFHITSCINILQVMPQRPFVAESRSSAGSTGRLLWRKQSPKISESVARSDPKL